MNRAGGGFLPLLLRALVCFTCSALWPFSPSAASPLQRIPRDSDPALRSENATFPGSRSVGHQRLLFLRVVFAQETGEPISATDATSMVQQTAETLHRISCGHLTLTSTVTAVIPLPRTRADYGNLSYFDRLMADAREAAFVLGYDWREYDFDVVYHAGVPGLGVANAQWNGRGIQMQGGNALNLVHELAHNLGLSHANTWDTTGPPLIPSSPPLPSNFTNLAAPLEIPVDPQSLVTFDLPTGLGRVVDAADYWDIMGLGDTDLSVASKIFLGWLPANALLHVSEPSSTNRIYAGDAPWLVTNLTRGLRLRGPRAGPAGMRDYCVELPPAQGGFPSASGILVRWIDSQTDAPPASPLLLDATVGSPMGFQDAILTTGRTFFDRVRGLAVTVSAAGDSPAGRWVDVITHQRLPAHSSLGGIELQVDKQEVNAGETVHLSASLKLPTGRELVWSWDLGNGTATSNGQQADKSWAVAGDYSVRVEASDMKGGTASAHAVIRVGTHRGLHIRGRILDSEDNPVADALVHVGKQHAGQPLSAFPQTRTDSEGTYTLINLVPDTYPISAFHPDYEILPRTSVSLGATDVAGIDFRALPLPQAQIGELENAPVAESAAAINAFTVERRVLLEQPLTAYLAWGGSAQAGADYLDPFIDHLDFPPGVSRAGISLTILDDDQEEPSEEISLTLIQAEVKTRLDDASHAFRVYYPGWELSYLAGAPVWTHTRPEYVLGSGAERELLVLDNDGSKGLTRIRLLDTPQVELSLTAVPGTRWILQVSTNLKTWVSIGTNEIPSTGESSTSFPRSGEAKYFRYHRSESETGGVP